MGGTSQVPLTPSLGGQPAFFAVAQLFLFREGRRDNTQMTAAAKGLKDEELQAFADLIEKLPPPKPPAGKPDPIRYRGGQALAKEHNCAGCLGEKADGGRNVPRIAAQREDYLLKALKDYRDGKRVGYGNAQMPETVHGLKDPQLADLAYYFSRLPGR